MKKYAVYGSPTGEYCYRYADTMDDLAGTGFEELITEEQLPVVFDGRGGYFRFREDDHIRLQPENSSMEPIIVHDCAIVGKVVALFRRIR